MLAKDAADVIDRIPNNVSATEYYTVSLALSNSGLVDRALRLSKRSLDVANDANDGVDIFRFYAGTLFTVGEFEKGRSQYRNALDIFSKFPAQNTYYIEMTHMFTEMSWAQSEFNSRQCSYVNAHITEAQRHLSALAPGSQTDTFKNQFAELQQRVKSCVP